MWAAQYFDFRAAAAVAHFGLAWAPWASACRRRSARSSRSRDKLVIDIDGDARIRMNIGEMETVTTYDLPVKIVVLNNNGDGMVKQWQKLFHKGRLSASEKTLHTKDFIKAAQADGFKCAVRLDKQADVPARRSRNSSRSRAPAFLEVIIDPDAGVYPMVGPGQPYEAMITGDWIPSRKKVDVKPPGATRCSDRIVDRDARVLRDHVAGNCLDECRRARDGQFHSTDDGCLPQRDRQLCHLPRTPPGGRRSASCVPRLTRCMTSAEVRKLIADPDYGYVAYKSGTHGKVPAMRIWHYVLEKKTDTEGGTQLAAWSCGSTRMRSSRPSPCTGRLTSKRR